MRLEWVSYQYSIFSPASDAWWGFCCCNTVTFRYIYFVGITATSTFLTTSDIYTASTDTWASATAVSVTARYEVFNTTNVTGDVYCTCGNTGLGVISGTQNHIKYSFRSGAWTTKTNCPTPARGFSRGGIADTTRGNVFISAGINTINTYLVQTDKYSESGNTWTASTNLSTPGRQNPNMASILAYDSGYIIGGKDSVFGDPSLTRIEQLAFSSEVWTTKTTMGTGRAGPAIFILGSKLYAVAGQTSTPTNLNSIEEYDPSGNAWTTKTAMTLGGTSNSPGCSDTTDLLGYYVSSGAIQHQVYTPDLWTTKSSAITTRGSPGAGGTS